MTREKGGAVPGGQTRTPETPKAGNGEYAVRPSSDEWAAGFAACLYLFTGRYADYARERDLHFNPQR